MAKTIYQESAMEYAKEYLDRLLDLVIDGELSNDRETLLGKAVELLSQISHDQES